MKKIITALNNPELNKELEKEKNIKVMNKDIIYKEGILEILEIKKEIDLIIINYDLSGKITIEELIQKIKKINKKIEIIFILEKESPEKEKILKKYEIKNIYYNNKINIKKLIQIIQEKNKKNEKELEEEIIKLKKIIEEGNKKEKKQEVEVEKKCSKKHSKRKENGKHKIERIKKSLLIEETEENPKSHLALSLIEANKKEKKRILLVDLKINHEDLHIAFNKTKIYKKITNKFFLIHINKNIKLLTGLSNFLKNYDEKEIRKIIFIIEKNAKKYDKIIIEILENNFPKLNEKIIEKIEKNIFIISDNIKDIKNKKEKIKKYKKIKSTKIYLFLNKKNKIKISPELLKEIFNNKIKILRKEKQIWKLIK